MLLGVVPIMLWLGWWQWRGGIEGNSPQTTGYAFQWWIFAAFAIGLWARLVRDELRRQRAVEAGVPEPGAEPGGADESAAAQDEAPAPYLVYRAPVTKPEVRDDTELGRYNEYLAQLNAQDGQSTGETA